MKYWKRVFGFLPKANACFFSPIFIFISIIIFIVITIIIIFFGVSFYISKKYWKKVMFAFLLKANALFLLESRSNEAIMQQSSPNPQVVFSTVVVPWNEESLCNRAGWLGTG